MELSYIFSAGIFVQLALLCYVAGMLTRNELLLRLLVLIGTGFYIIYYYFISDTPLWDAIWASAVIGLANLSILFVIMLERSTVGMSAKMIDLYGAFPTLNPGQFRRIMKSADLVLADEDTYICREGERLDHLFLVASGHVRFQRDGVEGHIGKGNFVGEISYLIDGPATADVIVPRGAEYVQWDKANLAKQTQKSPALSNALSALFNRDIAAKLASSRPTQANVVAMQSSFPR